MSGINKVTILGNVGKIESKTSQTGSVIVNLSIATSYKTKEGTEVTEWHNCVAFGKLAEIMQKYVVKGNKLYLEGSLKTDSWQTQTGETRYATKIIAKEMQLLTPKAAESAPMQNSGAQQAAYSNKDSLPFDDSIPF